MTAQLLLPLLLAAAVFAQGPPNAQPQPSSNALRQYLHLTDAQVQKMREAGDAARRQAAEKEKALRPEIEQKHAALRELMGKSSPDAAAVGKAMLEIQDLERQIQQAHESARNGFVQVLNEEQKARFRAVMDAALLPQAVREAVQMGLVPGTPGIQMQPHQPPFHQPMRRSGPHMMGSGPQGPGEGQPQTNRGPNPPR